MKEREDKEVWRTVFEEELGDLVVGTVALDTVQLVRQVHRDKIVVCRRSKVSAPIEDHQQRRPPFACLKRSKEDSPSPKTVANALCIARPLIKQSSTVLLHSSKSRSSAGETPKRS